MKIAKERAEAEYASNPLVAAIRDQMTTFARIHPEESATAVALSKRSDLEPTEMYRLVDAEVKRVEAAELQKRQAATLERQQARDKADADLAQAQLSEVESRQRLERGVVNGE